MLKLALGTMFFGTRVNESTSFGLLDRFVAAGGTMIDTANSYAFWVDPSGSDGQSERVVGRWLTRRAGSRERVYLSTKVGAAPVGPGEWPANAEGLSAAAIKAAARASLGRLQTDRIDLYWTHMEDRSVPLEETGGALAELVAAGTVGRLGCSNHPLWRVERARQVARANRTEEKEPRWQSAGSPLRRRLGRPRRRRHRRAVTARCADPPGVAACPTRPAATGPEPVFLVALSTDHADVAST